MKDRTPYLMRKYGITQADYLYMFEHGNYACWICKRPPLPGKNLNVDHEHLTKAQRKEGEKFGRVRGLLCYFCNKFMVGRRKQKDIPLLHSLIAYLSSDLDWRNANATNTTIPSWAKTATTKKGTRRVRG